MRIKNCVLFILFLKAMTLNIYAGDVFSPDPEYKVVSDVSLRNIDEEKIDLWPKLNALFHDPNILPTSEIESKSYFSRNEVRGEIFTNEILERKEVNVRSLSFSDYSNQFALNFVHIDGDQYKGVSAFQKNDRLITIWNSDTGVSSAYPRWSPSTSTCALLFSEWAGKSLLVSMEDKTIKTFEPARCADWILNGKYCVFSTSSDIYIYNLYSAEVEKNYSTFSWVAPHFYLGNIIWSDQVELFCFNLVDITQKESKRESLADYSSFLCLMDSEAKNIRGLLKWNSNSSFSMDFSPDGKWVAFFLINGSSSGNPEKIDISIALASVDGSQYMVLDVMDNEGKRIRPFTDYMFWHKTTNRLFFRSELCLFKRIHG